MARIAVFVIPAVLLALTVPAAAQARKKAAAKVPAAITVTNARATGVLNDFGLTDPQGKVFARLGKPLAPGKSVSLKVNKGATCVMTAVGNFDDMSDSSVGDVDLCKDKVVRFTD
jgi:hypothetical protein